MSSFGSMITLKRSIILICLTLWLTACSSNPPAPVIDRLPPSKSSLPAKQTKSLDNKSLANRPTYKAGDWRPDTYLVKKGDTLFSIGLEFGYDYKEVAQVNNIAAPYNIKIGQTLKLSALKEKPAQASNDAVVVTPLNTEASSTSTTVASSDTPAKPTIIAITEPKAIREPYSDDALKKPLPTAKPVIAKVADKTTEKASIDKTGIDKATTATTNKADAKIDNAATSEEFDWAWPTKGKVIANFNEASNKGIDIAGTTGQAVNAAAAGKVIYSGSDLRGYGKLVIIKHNANYLSVYAHNSKILIKEGQQVSRGQKIAEMGNTDSDTVKLHFEIRHQGKSVDPSKYLSSNE